jgi:hypothetical protein
MPAVPFTLAFPVGLLLLVIGVALALAFRRRWLGVFIGGLGLFIVAATAAVVLYMSLKPM